MFGANIEAVNNDGVTSLNVAVTISATGDLEDLAQRCALVDKYYITENEVRQKI